MTALLGNAVTSPEGQALGEGDQGSCLPQAYTGDLLGNCLERETHLLKPQRLGFDPAGPYNSFRYDHSLPRSAPSAIGLPLHFSTSSGLSPNSASRSSATAT